MYQDDQPVTFGLLRQQLAEFRVELGAELRAELRADIAEAMSYVVDTLGARMDAQLAELRQAIDGRFEQIDGRFEQFDGRFEQFDDRFEIQTAELRREIRSAALASAEQHRLELNDAALHSGGSDRDD